MMIGYGLTSAIVNPLHEEVMTAICAAEVLAGRDRMCKRWIKRARAKLANPGGGARQAG